MLRNTQCARVWVDWNSFPLKAGERKLYKGPCSYPNNYFWYCIYSDIVFCSTNITYHTSNLHECMGVNGKALHLCVIYEKFTTSRVRICIKYYNSYENSYQDYKSHENSYQVLQVTLTASESLSP